MIASREQTLPFQTKIFLTVFLVALVPVFLCFAMLLPALVSHERSRAEGRCKRAAGVADGQNGACAFRHEDCAG